MALVNGHSQTVEPTFSTFQQAVRQWDKLGLLKVGMHSVAFNQMRQAWLIESIEHLREPGSCPPQVDSLFGIC